MFCFNCGSKLADGSNFCPYCGTKLTNSANDNKNITGNGHPSMQPTFVPAKCTCCGATLEVDPRQEAAVCRFCNTPFIVEKAINNYNVSLTGNIHVSSATINVQGKNLENLVKRARIFEGKGELQNALNYYEQVLDINVENKEALIGSELVRAKISENKGELRNALKHYEGALAIDVKNQEALVGKQRVTEAIHNYIYLMGNAYMGFFYSGTLKLMKGILRYENVKGQVKSYDINQIKNLRYDKSMISFIYPGQVLGVVIGIESANPSAATWFEAITNAQKGIYPKLD